MRKLFSTEEAAGQSMVAADNQRFAASHFARSVLDFPLQQCNLCRRQVEQFVDAGVDVGFGVGQLSGEGLHGGTVLGEVGFPLVGGLWFLERVGLELEAGLQGVAEFVQGLFPPRLRFVVQRAERLALGILAERLTQAALEVRLQFVALRSQSVVAA